MKLISIKPVLPKLAVILFVFGITSCLVAGDVYVATLSGVECAGCKKTIAKSLAKIKGVQTIRIEKSSNGDHKMTVTTDGLVPISRTQATTAIKHAEHYQIKSWAKSSS